MKSEKKTTKHETETKRWTGRSEISIILLWHNTFGWRRAWVAVCAIYYRLLLLFLISIFLCIFLLCSLLRLNSIWSYIFRDFHCLSLKCWKSTRVKYHARYSASTHINLRTIYICCLRQYSFMKCSFAVGLFAENSVDRPREKSHCFDSQTSHCIYPPNVCPCASLDVLIDLFCWAYYCRRS